MQRSWRNDADKLTFIICAPSSSPSPPAPPSAQAGQMIGDVNLFVERDDAAGLVGEVEIMIANQRFRGSGYGKAALQAFLWYVLRERQAIADEYDAATTRRPVPG